MPRWTEHQLAMLREMGIDHVWPHEGGAPQGPTPARPDPVQGRSAVPTPQPVAKTEGTTSATPPVESVMVTNRHRPAGAPAATRPAAAEVTPVLAHLPEGMATMGWADLQHAASACRACALCDSRRQAVFGSAAPSPGGWMLVGEAPGEPEEEDNEAFRGRSGQLLDRMLDAAGLTRHGDSGASRVSLVNAVKCRPPGNRTPSSEEVARCEPFLRRQIELVQPRVIVAMGRAAVLSLLNSAAPIGQLRGQSHEVHGVPVVATFHPNYLLRNPADKALAWDDLCRARELAQWVSR